MEIVAWKIHQNDICIFPSPSSSSSSSLSIFSAFAVTGTVTMWHLEEKCLFMQFARVSEIFECGLSRLLIGEKHTQNKAIYRFNLQNTQRKIRHCLRYPSIRKSIKHLKILENYDNVQTVNILCFFFKHLRLAVGFYFVCPLIIVIHSAHSRWSRKKRRIAADVNNSL